MTDQERVDVLSSVDELSRLDRVALASLRRYFDEVYLPAGAVVAREDRFSHEFFVVAEGQVEECRRGRATRLGPGQAFGWRTMRERGRNDATVVTVSPAHLLVMSHAQFRALEALSEHPYAGHSARLSHFARIRREFSARFAHLVRNPER